MNLVFDKSGSVALSHLSEMMKTFPMSLDMSLYLKEVNIQKSISFFQRYLFGILLRATQVLSNMNYAFSFFIIQIKAIFL